VYVADEGGSKEQCVFPAFKSHTQSVGGGGWDISATRLGGKNGGRGEQRRSSEVARTGLVGGERVSFIGWASFYAVIMGDKGRRKNREGQDKRRRRHCERERSSALEPLSWKGWVTFSPIGPKQERSTQGGGLKEPKNPGGKRLSRFRSPSHNPITFVFLYTYSET